MRRFQSTLMLLFLASGLLAACATEDPKVTEARKAAEGTDKEIADDLAAPNHAEAREWLQRPAALGWKVSVNEMRTMADELYAAGATTVYVIGIEQFQGREIAARPPWDPTEKGLSVDYPLYSDARPDEGSREGTIAKTLDRLTSLMQAHSNGSEGRPSTRIQQSPDDEDPLGVSRSKTSSD